MHDLGGVKQPLGKEIAVAAMPQLMSDYQGELVCFEPFSEPRWEKQGRSKGAVDGGNCHEVGHENFVVRRPELRADSGNHGFQDRVWWG